MPLCFHLGLKEPDLSLLEAHTVLKPVPHPQVLIPANGLTLNSAGFTHFMMFSEWQEVLNPVKRQQIYQDMSQPLSHYWIASSHNT